MQAVSIVLPTYNEADNLEKFVLAVLDQQKRISKYKLHIVVSDSHSKDGTKEVARKLTKKYKNVHFIEVGRGLGLGQYKGHKYAIDNIKPKILMQLDADGQVDERVVPKLIKAIDQGYDFAIGSRFAPGGKNKLSLSRRIFTLGASWVCRIFMGPLDVHEFTNSARAFTPDLFKRINWKRYPMHKKTFISQPAFLHEAILAGARYKEVPIIFRDRAEGYSKNKIINYTIDVFLYTLSSRFKRIST